MAKSLIGTLLTIALILLTGKGKTTKQTSFKSGGTATTAKTSSAGTLPKNVEIIKFGPYEWRVLERKGGIALIITEGIIERQPYHTERYSTEKKAPFVGTTWEKSDLRKYLNGKFLEKFSPADTARIVEVTNQNPDNPWFKTRVSAIAATNAVICDSKGGNPTNDKVFCLSIEEACRYFGDSTARLKNKGFTIVGSGASAKIVFDPGVKTSISDTVMISDQNNKNRIAILPEAMSPLKKKEDRGSHWWLRSPGEVDIQAAIVTGQGAVKMNGDVIYSLDKEQGSDRDFGGVRPALWLKM